MARILHVLNSPRAEGTPRLVLDWLTVSGHDQAVAFLSGDPPDLLDQFRRTGAVLAVGDAIVPGPRKFLRISRSVSRWVREYRPDLVIAWPLGFSHWIFLGARSAGSRAALLSHGGNPPGLDWVNRYVMGWICLWTTAMCRGRMIACSRYVQRQYRGIALIPSATIGFAYNSVQGKTVSARAELARSGRTTREPLRAVMVATLERHKDHPTLIRAAALLRDRGIRIEIGLAGTGREEPALRRLAADLGVEGLVKFLGMRADVPELLGQSDLFVLSTTPQEGRPGVIMEALAAGLPIVASDVEPVREVLEDGRWGFLVPRSDAEALATAIETLVRRLPLDPAGFAAGQAHAYEFTPQRMIADYLREAGMAQSTLRT
jgi:glycosyltransferase involved in cell wall biosynthesis